MKSRSNNCPWLVSSGLRLNPLGSWHLGIAALAVLFVLSVRVRGGEPVYTPYTFTRFAGQLNHVGQVDGTGAAAQFAGPTGLAVDAEDNVYVADLRTIRKITPEGVVTTVATGFNHPAGVGFDGSGNFYVAEPSNFRISKVSPDGVVTVFAGGYEGPDDGIGTAARFFYPYGPAVDSFGNVYVADSQNETIRKITPDAVVTTMAGMARRYGSIDGVGENARFYLPQAVSVDGSGNIIVGDVYNHEIRKVSPEGLVTTLAGNVGFSGGEDGTGTSAHFMVPMGIANDGSGSIYIADQGAGTIRRIDSQGVVTTLGGYPLSGGGSTEGTGGTAHFENPTGIAIDSSGNLYVSDPPYAIIYKGIPATVVSAPVRVDASKVRISFNTTLHTSYSVLASTNLSDWIAIGTAAGSGGMVSFTDTNAISSQCFYRVQP